MQGICKNCGNPITAKAYKSRKNYILFHPCSVCGQYTQAIIEYGVTHYFQTSKPSGLPTKKVRSVRLLDDDYDTIVRKHGSLGNALEKAKHD